MAKQYISKINLPVGTTPTATDLYVKDSEAVHVLNTYNGGKTFGTKTIGGTVTDVKLADTPITNSEIDSLFTSST